MNSIGIPTKIITFIYPSLSVVLPVVINPILTRKTQGITKCRFILSKQWRCTFGKAVIYAATVDLLLRTCDMAARGCITLPLLSIYLLPASLPLLCSFHTHTHTHTFMQTSLVFNQITPHRHPHPLQRLISPHATHHHLSPHSVQLQCWSRPLLL